MVWRWRPGAVPADVLTADLVGLVDDRVLTAEGKLDYAAIRPLARVGYHDYTSFSETFSMPIPGAEGAAAAGLEGRA